MPKKPPPHSSSGRDSDSDATELRRSLGESAVYLVSKTVPFVFNLFFIKFYTNVFTTEIVGTYETAVALGMILASLGTGWLQMSLLRFYPKKEAWGIRPLVSAILVGFTVSAMTIGLGLAAIYPFRKTDPGIRLGLNLAGWVFLLFLANSFYMLTSTFLRAQRRVVWFSAVSSLPSVGNFLACATLAFLVGKTLDSLVLGTCFSLLFPSVLALGVILRPLFRSGLRGSAPEKGSTPDVLRTTMAFGLPLALNQSCSQLLNLSDRYLILVLRNAEEAGIYSAAYRLADFAMRFVILSLMMSAYTSVTEVYEKRGRERAENLVSSLSSFFLLLGTPIAVGLGLVREDLMKLLTGPGFEEGADLLIWIGMGNLFLGLSQYQHFGLHLGGKTMRLASMTFSAALLNIVLNLVFVPVFGYQAAAVTTFVSFGCLALAAPILGRPWLIWRVSWRFVARLAGATCVLIVLVVGVGRVCESLSFRLGLQVLLGGAGYFLSLFLMGERFFRTTPGKD